MHASLFEWLFLTHEISKMLLNQILHHVSSQWHSEAGGYADGSSEEDHDQRPGDASAGVKPERAVGARIINHLPCQYKSIIIWCVCSTRVLWTLKDSPLRGLQEDSEIQGFPPRHWICFWFCFVLFCFFSGKSLHSFYGNLLEIFGLFVSAFGDGMARLKDHGRSQYQYTWRRTCECLWCIGENGSTSQARQH